MNYGRGTIEDKILVGQHDVNWIEVDCPGEGNLLIFNNGATSGFGEQWLQLLPALGVPALHVLRNIVISTSARNSR